MNAEQIRQRMTTIKAEQPGFDCVGFVSGSVVHFFFDDACTVARTLGVVLSQRNELPTCSIPSPAIERHAERLKAAGVTVLIEYPDNSAERDSELDDVQPVAWRDLTTEDQNAILKATQAAEKNALRAAALIERVAAYGLRAEAEALGVAGWANFQRAHMLDALESILAAIEEAGGVPPNKTRQ